MDSEVPTSSNQKHESKYEIRSTQNNQEITEMNNCSTPEIEAPLSPVLSNSKQSLRLIAKRKSRIKLLNKFSQSSLVSEETLTPIQTQVRIEPNEPSLSITNSNILEDISNIKQDSIDKINPTSPLITKAKICKEILIEKQDVIEKNSNKDNALEERMKRCIEIQKNKKFCYNIAKSSSKMLSTSENTESSSSVTKVLDFPGIEKSKSYGNYDVIKPELSNNSDYKKETDFNFKIPISPVTATKFKKTKLETVTNYEQNINIGFETGRGKKIKLSENALKRASKLFDDILDIPCESSNIPISGNKKSGDEKIVIIKNENISDLGFKTASGNVLKLSENSLKKVSNLFDDIYDLSNYTETSTKIEIRENVETKIDMCIKKASDATEASIKKINIQIKKPNQIIENKLDNKISEEISPDNKNVFTQITDTQMCWAADNAECLAEFMNSQWTPSPKDKLQQKTQQSGEKNTNQVLDDMEEFLSPEAEQLFGNLTVCEDGTIASRKSIQLDDSTSSIISPENTNKSIDISNMPSLFTKSDKKIISTESLNKTENIFQDCDDINDKNNKIHAKSSSFSASFNKNIDISKELLNNRVQNCDKNNDNIKKNEFAVISNEFLDEKIKTCKNISTYGFITASGKQVEVSEASLNSAKKLLNCDIEDHNETFDETLLTPINSESRMIKSEDALNLASNLDKNIFVPSEEIQEISNKKMNIDCAMASSNFTSSDKFSYNFKNNEKDKNGILKEEIVFEEIQFGLHDNNEDFNCCGFTWNEALKSLKILELYKRSFKLIENDIRKNDFRPLCLIFGNIRSSKGYRKKSYRSRKKNVYEFCRTPELFNTSTNMLTRSKRKTDVSCTPLVVIDLPEIVRSKRKSKDNSDNYSSSEIISIESSTTSSEKSTPDIYIDKVINNKKRDYETIKKLEDDFLSNLENTLKETHTILTCDINSLKEEFSEEANFNNTTINSGENVEQNTSAFQSSEPFLKISQDFFTKSNINYDLPTEENIIKNTEISKLENSSTAVDVKINFSIESNESLLTKQNEIIEFAACEINEDLSNKITSNITPESGIKPDISKVSNNENNSENSINKYQIEKENLDNFKSPKNDLKLEISTTSGTKIKTTEDNLKKARNIFQDCDISENINNTPKSVEKTKDSLNMSNNFGYISKEYIEIPKNTAPFGFSTASGKKIVISEESLKKTKNIFEDCYNTEKNINKNIETPKETHFGSLTVSRDNIAMCEESLNKSKNIFNDCNIPDENLIESPKNASLFETEKIFENKIAISEESLKEAKNLFEDCNITEKITNKNIETSKNTQSFGFATASGKKVTISEESLKKAKNIFEDYNITEEITNKKPETPKSTQSFGFATAAGKKVAISEESLKKAKDIFEDYNITEEITNKKPETPKSTQSFGFATASGKKVAISEESLKKAKDIFEDYNITEEITNKKPETPKSTQSFGFATASGKKVAISEESLKKAKDIFEDYNITEEITNKKPETPKSTQSFGFATASGKKVAISEESLKKAKDIFEDYNITEEITNKKPETPKSTQSFGFATASGKKVAISEESLKKAKDIFEDYNITEEISNKKPETPKSTQSFGFATASGKKVAISEESLKKAKDIFEDYNITEEISNKKPETPKSTQSFGFATASGKKVAISEESLKKAKNIFEDYNVTEEIPENTESLKNMSVFGFATASGEKVAISDDALKKAKNIFDDINETNTENSLKDTKYTLDESHSTPKTSNKNEFSKVIISEELLNKSNNISDMSEELNQADENISNNKHFEQKIDLNHSSKPKIINRPNSSPAITTNKSYSSPQISSNNSTPVLRNKTSSIRNSKKRNLGVTSCRQIDIPETNLKRAKLVFDDVDSPKKKELNTNNNHLLNNSPLYNKSNNSTIQTPQKEISKSTPSINISTHKKSLLNSTVTMKESNQIKSSLNVTPTKKSPNKLFSFGNEQENRAFAFQAKTSGDSNKWKLDLQKKLEMLKLEMSVIESRMSMLNKQEEIIQNGSVEHCRQRPGHLFTQKLNSDNKISLKEIVNNRRPGKNTEQICLNLGLDQSLLDINAQNSSSLHFHVPWFPNNNRTYPAVIRTEDGAIIIPNQSNYVGITEIEQGFLAMPGIDPKILPKKWVPNHFRWIVWKLASLERNYPDKFNNCLSVETVLSQLKYRYDREIDRAQRPAIRKIVECDDIAAKRMVLCVATIIKLTENKYELELTDGWYSIKTMLDAPLNSLVERNVLQSGMKLATQGAELLNCDGCHPLELPPTTRLQIHYNSTRRAAWDVKLGYQPNPGPMRISLRMVAANGGPVGGVTAYIARVYPISFMERSDVAITWRNERAELRRANQWDAAYTNTMETMQMRVQQELEGEWTREGKKNRTKRSKIKDVHGVLCGRTLYEFIEDSNDPDSVEELLTSDQISALRDYQTELNTERQSELTSRLRQKLASEKIQARNVSTVLKLRLVDVNSSYHHRMFSVWRPTEMHTQILKENIVIDIYNVSAKNNGTLSSIPRTQFEVDANIDTSKFENLTRFVLPISQTSNMELKPQFGEFDTIGIVVTIDIQPTGQILWLADERHRFLRIKIRDGPETCSLFEGISPGKLVAVLNLIHQKPFKSYGEAIGNLYTILSSYPQQTYLQDFMQEFIEFLPEDVEKYLEECKKLVDEFSSCSLKRKFELFPLNTNKSEEEIESLAKKLCGEENKQESLTLSDEEMALIDTQVM